MATKIMKNVCTNCLELSDASFKFCPHCGERIVPYKDSLLGAVSSAGESHSTDTLTQTLESLSITEEVPEHEESVDDAQCKIKKLHLLGEGSYGKTYVAKMNNETVALKEPIRSGFEKNEIEMLKIVKHQNIIRFIACQLLHGKLCILMELALNGNLYDVLHNPKKRLFSLTSKLKDQWTREVACGLDYLHNGLDHPIFHGDIKSPNVLISDKPAYTAKLSDFGLSEKMVRGSYSHSGNCIGSARWMAPEAVKSKRTNMSDVWSYGVLVWEMFMELVPFHEISRPHQILFNVGNGQSPYSPESDMNIPQKYRELLKNCFQVVHTRRWDFQRILRYLHDISPETLVDIGNYCKSFNGGNDFNFSARLSSTPTVGELRAALGAEMKKDPKTISVLRQTALHGGKPVYLVGGAYSDVCGCLHQFNEVQEERIVALVMDDEQLPIIPDVENWFIVSPADDERLESM